MPGPRLEATSHGRIYFHDADGVTWRIHDGVYRAGRWITSDPPDPAATHRVFVAKDGTQRATAFAPGEERRLFVDLVARQLQRAGYLERTRFDASGQQPR